MKNRSTLFAMVLLIIATMGMQAKAFAQNELEGRLVGTVTSTNGKTIYLAEQMNYGVYSIVAFTKSNGKYVEEKAFKVRKNYQSVINSVKYNDWVSSDPNGGFFAFNKSDNTLYVPLINEDLVGSDRYIVYRFDGQHFVRKGTDAGYWLHPSLHSFDYLFGIGRTKDHLVRLDQMEDGSIRYAAWSSKKTMKDKPSIILFTDDFDDEEGIAFYNLDFKYVFDYDNKELRVYEGEKLLKRQDMEVLYW